MANMSDFLESGLLNHVFRGHNFLKPQGMAIALTSGVPVESGSAKNLITGSFLMELPKDEGSTDTGYRRVDLGDPSTKGNATWKFSTDEEFAAGSGFVKN